LLCCERGDLRAMFDREMSIVEIETLDATIVAHLHRDAAKLQKRAEEVCNVAGDVMRAMYDVPHDCAIEIPLILDDADPALDDQPETPILKALRELLEEARNAQEDFHNAQEDFQSSSVRIPRAAAPVVVLATASPEHTHVAPATAQQPESRPATAPSRPAVENEFDEDGRMILSTPLEPLPRPAPTIIHPTPASRYAPPLRPPGSWLMASRLVAVSPPPPLSADDRAYMERLLKTPPATVEPHKWSSPEARQRWIDRCAKPPRPSARAPKRGGSRRRSRSRPTTSRSTEATKFQLAHAHRSRISRVRSTCGASGQAARGSLAWALGSGGDLEGVLDSEWESRLRGGRECG
jgi:hypothetical protein